MRKLILFSIVATFAAAATGFAIPAAAKEKAKVKLGDIHVKKTSDVATPKKTNDVATPKKMRIRGVVTRRDADTFGR